MFTSKHFLGYGERRRIAKRFTRLLVILSTMLILLNVSTVLADTLSDLTGTDSKASTSSSVDGGLLKGLNDSVDFSVEEEGTAKVKEPLKRIFGLIVQIGSYVLCGGVVAVTILDMIYVCIPIAQGVLSGGRVGQPVQQGQPGQPGMPGAMGGMSPMGGMGTMGGGMYGSRMGMGTMGAMGMAGAQQGMQPQQTGGLCWVTPSALNAVASAGTPDPATGKPIHPLKIYAKDARYVLISVPILLVLTATGILPNLGFAIGSVIGGFIQSGITMLGGF